jgi:hypothetical protein
MEQRIFHLPQSDDGRIATRQFVEPDSRTALAGGVVAGALGCFYVGAHAHETVKSGILNAVEELCAGGTGSATAIRRSTRPAAMRHEESHHRQPENRPKNHTSPFAKPTL